MPADPASGAISTYLQGAIVGAISVDQPPAEHTRGQLFYDRTTGNVYLRVSSGPPLEVPSWLLLNASVAAQGTPVLYLVDSRYGAPPGPNGPWPTIAAARAQLLADGYGPGPNGPATIMVLRGAYAENVSLDPGIRLSSMAQGQDGAVIVGTVSIPDPAGADTATSISGITIAPTIGNALEIGGSGSKQVYLHNVTLAPSGPGAAALSYTNSGGSLVVAINCNAAGEQGVLGSAFSSGQIVWFGGGLNGSVRAVRNLGVSMLLDQVIVGGAGSLEFGPGAVIATDVRCLQTFVRVAAGQHTIADMQCAGTATNSPLHIDAGATARLLGTISLRCDAANPMVIDGAGTIEGTPALQFVDGDAIASLLTFNTSSSSGHQQPLSQLVFTADPPSNPYAVSGRFDTLIVRAALSAQWTFNVERADRVSDGREFVFKNLDPTQGHRIDAPGSTVDAGLQPLPMLVSTQDFVRLRADKSFNDWVHC